MGQRAAVIWLLLFICWILFSYLIFIVFFSFSFGKWPKKLCFPHSHFKGNLMLQQGPRGKHFGKTAPALSCISFFSLGRKEKKNKRGGKGRGALSVGRREAGIGFQKSKQCGCFILLLEPRTLSFCSATEISHSSKLTLLWSLFFHPFTFLSLPEGSIKPLLIWLSLPQMFLDIWRWRHDSFLPSLEGTLWGKAPAVVRHPLAVSWRSRDRVVYGLALSGYVSSCSPHL